MLTESDLASRWRVSKGSLANARSAGRGVSFVKLSPGRVRYLLSTVEAYELAALVVTAA
jgi:hypothetical protein